MASLMADVTELGQPQPLRVVVVDRDDAMRLLVRLQFELDDRFEVAAEGATSAEAVALAAEHQPDLVVMPLYLSGPETVQAVPELRRNAPDTAVVLYTLQADAGMYQAALAAGALHVLDKGEAALGFVDHLVGALLERTSPDEATIEVHVGPVSCDAARGWVANTRTILDAAADNPDVLGATIPEDVLEFFRSVLQQWADIAATADEFRWVARARPDDVARVVSYWGFIDAMTDEQVEQLGVGWSSPAGDHPFFRALTAGVLDALRRNDETQRLAARLTEQWQE
jgi:CheY-like chemotaxis protein